jgi:NRAMP (natural resistance-associated macrophage protein)-like metal ion transporter
VRLTDHRRVTAKAEREVAKVWFAPSADRRSLLDRAHRGDVVGALGKIPSVDTGPRLSMRRKVATLLAIMGPAVIVMVADNDAGGIATYAQAGQDFGLRLLWLVVVLAGVLLVNQEMVGRLGAVTGAGHARLIYERFGRRWGSFALGDLLVVNFLVIVTEFIGIALGLGYFGVSREVSVPLAAVALIALPLTGSFRRWERAMYVFVAASFAVVPLLVLVRHSAKFSPLAVGHPQIASEGTVFVVIALIGTTVAPWQLFFQQSNVVDKRITARWLSYERVDTAVGMVLFAVVAIAVLAACALAFSGTPLHGQFISAGTVAEGLRHRAGAWVGALFAVALINGSILGAAAVTLSTAYAIGEVRGTKHSLHRKWRDAPVFHGSYAALIALAAAIVLIPRAPLGVVTTGVQVLAGVLLPSALVFLLLLCNDRTVLGPWVNPRWLNVIATSVVAVLLVLSGLLTVSTLFPQVAFGLLVTIVPVTCAAIVGALYGVRLSIDRASQQLDGAFRDKTFWTMPSMETLSPPRRSPSRTVGLIVLRVYLVVAMVAVIVKVVRLITGS